MPRGASSFTPTQGKQHHAFHNNNIQYSDEHDHPNQQISSQPDVLHQQYCIDSSSITEDEQVQEHLAPVDRIKNTANRLQRFSCPVTSAQLRQQDKYLIKQFEESQLQKLNHAINKVLEFVDNQPIFVLNDLNHQSVEEQLKTNIYAQLDDIEEVLLWIMSNGTQQLHDYKLKCAINRTSRGQTSIAMAACVVGHVTCLKQLIEGDVDVSLKDVKYNTALHYAARFGHSKCVSLVCKQLNIVRQGYKDSQKWYNDVVTSQGVGQRTALAIACIYNHIECFQELIEYKCDSALFGEQVTKVVEKEHGPLLYAILFKNEKIVAKLLKVLSRPYLLSRDKDQRGMVCHAIINGHWAIADMLIQHMADVWHCTIEDIFWGCCSQTLIRAGREKQWKIVQKQLQYLQARIVTHQEPANPIHGTDRDGLTILHYAAQHGEHKLIHDLVVSYKLPVGTLGQCNITPLQVAAFMGRVKAVETLIELTLEQQSGSPDRLQSSGGRAMNCAVWGGKRDIADAVVVSGAIETRFDLDRLKSDEHGQMRIVGPRKGHVTSRRTEERRLQDYQKQCSTQDCTEEHTCAVCAHPHRHIVNILIKHGCSVNVRSIHQHTSLMRAVIVDDKVLVQTFLNQKVDVQLVDENGWSARCWAIVLGRKGIEDMIVNHIQSTEHPDKDHQDACYVSEPDAAAQRVLVKHGQQQWGGSRVMVTVKGKSVGCDNNSGHYGVQMKAGQDVEFCEEHGISRGWNPVKTEAYCRQWAYSSEQGGEGVSQLQVVHYGIATWEMYGMASKLCGETKERGMEVRPTIVAIILQAHLRQLSNVRDVIPVHARLPLGITILHVAAAHSTYAFFKALITEHPQLLHKDNPINVNTPAQFGVTPLHIASRHVDTVKCLLKHGADPLAEDQNKYTPLHWAIESGDTEVVQVLVEQLIKLSPRGRAEVGQQPLCVQQNVVSPVWLAAYYGHHDMMKHLLLYYKEYTSVLDAGYGPSQGVTAAPERPKPVVCKNGECSSEACSFRHSALIKDDSRTPLCVASMQGHNQVVEQLVLAGANVQIKQANDCVTPLILAAHGGHEYSIHALLKHLPPTQLADVVNYNAPHVGTALMVAVIEGHYPAVETLLQYGAKWNVKREDGATSVLCASYLARPVCLSLMIEHRLNVVGLEARGSRPNVAKCVREDDGLTPLMAACLGCSGGYDELFDWVAGLEGQGKVHGPRKEASAIEGNGEKAHMSSNTNICVPVQSRERHAAFRPALDCIKLLVQQGADGNARDKLGYSAVDFMLARVPEALCDQPKDSNDGQPRRRLDSKKEQTDDQGMIKRVLQEPSVASLSHKISLIQYAITHHWLSATVQGQQHKPYNPVLESNCQDLYYSLITLGSDPLTNYIRDPIHVRPCPQAQPPTPRSSPLSTATNSHMLQLQNLKQTRRHIKMVANDLKKTVAHHTGQYKSALVQQAYEMHTRLSQSSQQFAQCCQSPNTPNKNKGRGQRLKAQGSRATASDAGGNEQGAHRSESVSQQGSGNGNATGVDAAGCHGSGKSDRHGPLNHELQHSEVPQLPPSDGAHTVDEERGRQQLDSTEPQDDKIAKPDRDEDEVSLAKEGQTPSKFNATPLVASAQGAARRQLNKSKSFAGAPQPGMMAEDKPAGPGQATQKENTGTETSQCMSRKQGPRTVKQSHPDSHHNKRWTPMDTALEQSKWMSIFPGAVRKPIRNTDGATLDKGRPYLRAGYMSVASGSVNEQRAMIDSSSGSEASISDLQHIITQPQATQKYGAFPSSASSNTRPDRSAPMPFMAKRWQADASNSGEQAAQTCAQASCSSFRTVAATPSTGAMVKSHEQPTLFRTCNVPFSRDQYIQTNTSSYLTYMNGDTIRSQSQTIQFSIEL